MTEPSFDELPEVDLDWPKSGDRLFLQSAWAYGAYVARDTKERQCHLTKGYKLAADLLVEQAEADPWQRQKLGRVSP